MQKVSCPQHNITWTQLGLTIAMRQNQILKLRSRGLGPLARARQGVVSLQLFQLTLECSRCLQAKQGKPRPGRNIAQ